MSRKSLGFAFPWTTTRESDTRTGRPRWFATKLATKKAGDRTFCEDAVNQTLGLPLTGALSAEDKKRYRALTLAAAKRAHWNEIIVRHALMMDEYAPVECEQDLARFLAAIQHSIKTGDTLMMFGY